MACNHVSFLDPPLLGAACPRRINFMARASLFKQPILGWYLRRVEAISLLREQADLPAIRESITRLRRGEVVAIFPEGGRQLTGQLGTAKRGVGVLAISAQVPVVPVYVHGTFAAWPPNARWPKPTKIRVAFGPMISYTTGSAQRIQGRASRLSQAQLADAVTHQWRRLEEQLHDRTS